MNFDIAKDRMINYWIGPLEIFLLCYNLFIIDKNLHSHYQKLIALIRKFIMDHT